MPNDMMSNLNQPKVILNAGEAVQNVVGYKEIVEITTKTLKVLTKQLLDISGPFSRNAFILKSADVLAGGSQATGTGSDYQVFTRDGIKTLEKIEFASPLQRYIKDEILRWVGSRVDDACKDGTTSAMIFTSSFVVDLMKARERLSFVSLTEIERIYDEVKMLLLAEVSKKVITADTIKEYLNKYFKAAQRSFTDHECTYLLARMMADTASSGNTQIADAVATVVSNTPQIEGIDTNIIIETPLHETVESSVKAVQDEYEYKIPVTVLTPELLNYERNTEFKCDRAHLLVLPEGVTRDSMTGIGLETYLTNLPEYESDANTYTYKDEKRYSNPDTLIFLIPSIANNHDSMHFDQVLEIAQKKGYKCFIGSYERTFGYKSTGTEWIVIAGLYAKADTPLLTEILVGNLNIPSVEPFMIKEVKAYCDHHFLYLDNIIAYKITEKGAFYKNKVSSKITQRSKGMTDEEIKKAQDLNIHPGEIRPDLYPTYIQTRDWIVEYVSRLTSTADASWNVNIADAKRTLASISVGKPWKIIVSGKHHERAMYQAIIEDAAGSTTVALKHGVYFNGPIQLLQSCFTLLSNEEMNKSNMIIHATILNAIMTATLDMVYAMFGRYGLRLIKSLDPVLEQVDQEFGYFNAYQDSYFVNGLGMQPFRYIYATDETPVHDLNLSIASSEYFEKNKDAEPRFISYVRSLLMKDTLKPDTPVLTPPCQVANLFEVLLTREKEVALKYVFTDNLIAPGTLYDDGTLVKR